MKYDKRNALEPLSYLFVILINKFAILRHEKCCIVQKYAKIVFALSIICTTTKIIKRK